jgi:spore coat protein CotF
MSMQLSKKEQMLLKDMLHHEELCIGKYGNYAQQARDPQLQQLFATYQTKEQQHHDTINQLLQGQIPSLASNQSGQSGQGQGQGQQTVQWSNFAGASGMVDQNDATLCTDALTTEKFVSGAYDTVIFEAVNQPVRQALQHIQKEEQEHGAGIFDYMQQHGMYQVE